jgi:hypothetical protein
MKTKPNTNHTAFRIKFVDKHGSVLMNRASEKSLYVRNGKIDVEFLEYSTRIDARENGVKILERVPSEDGLTFLVDYL